MSIRGNSRQTWHLPLKTGIDLVDAEVTNNAKIAKLMAQRIITVQQEERTAPPPKAQEHGRRPQPQVEGGEA